MKALLIAEKPSLMRDIKAVYDKFGHVDTIDFKAFVGHTLRLISPEEYKEDWADWKLDTLPMIPEKFKYKVELKDVYNDIVDQIKKGKYDYLINACDAGREGELIFNSFYNHLGCTIPVKRFWASDTTEETVGNALKNLLDDSEPSLQRLKISSQYRAYFDWLVGMNFSRAVTLKTKANIPVGRVKTPTLKIIVDRELEILNFKPKDFWELQAEYEGFSGIWFNKETGETRITDKNKINDLITTLDKEGVVSEVIKKQEKNYAPTLHSLLELQKEANRAYGYTADQTLKIAQDLYEKRKLLSYPRTESRYLPKAMVKEISSHIENLKEIPDVKDFIIKILNEKNERFKVLETNKYVDDSKVTDHHAIIPTKLIPKLDTLSKEEYNVYLLVVKRFISIFLEPLIVNKTNLVVDVEGNLFKSSGKSIVQKGFTELYSIKDKDVIIPELIKGDNIKVEKFNILTKKTMPPKRYDDSSLLDAMQGAGKFVDDDKLKNLLKETAGLGTSATRADIIKDLVKRNMIERKGKNIFATEFGIEIINVLGSRDICSPELTAKWEMKLRDIEDGKYNGEQFYKEMIDYIESLTQDLILNVNQIIKTKDSVVIGKCPKCGGDIIEGKSYYLCSNYKKSCDFIIPKELFKSKISKSDVKKIIDGGITEDKNFIFKKNKQGTGKLKIDSEGKLKIIFPEKKEQQVVGKCPKCGSDIIEGSNFYICKEFKKTCDFIISKEIFEATITKADVLNLLNNESTDEKTFTWKSKKKSKAKLILDENKKLKFIFENKPKSDTNEHKDYKVIGKCPHCGGDVINANDFFVCSNYPKDCHFNLKKTINKATIKEEDAIALINGNVTRSINFTWKNGKSGEAKLKYSNKLEFVF